MSSHSKTMSTLELETWLDQRQSRFAVPLAAALECVKLLRATVRDHSKANPEREYRGCPCEPCVTLRRYDRATGNG